VSIEVLTEQKLSTSAVKAFLAKLGIAGVVSYFNRHNLGRDKLCNDIMCLDSGLKSRREGGLTTTPTVSCPGIY
jgi:hypothetical protein